MDSKEEQVSFCATISTDDFILRLIDIFTEARIDCEVVANDKLRLSDENSVFIITVKALQK